MKTRFLIVLVLIAINISSCVKRSKIKDLLIFSNLDSMQYIIIEMDTLLYKLPKANTSSQLRYYEINMKNELIINNEFINKLEDLSINDFNDKIFDNLRLSEKQRLKYDILYLYKNHISQGLQSQYCWQFEYYYYDDPSCDYCDRCIINIYNQNDTSNKFFRYMHKILDVKKNLVLYTINDTVRNYPFNPPDFPQIINPYDTLDKTKK